MQVVQPGAHVVAGVPTVSPGLGQVGAHLAPEQACRDGGGTVDPHATQPRARVVELAACHADSRTLQSEDRGVVPEPVGVEARPEAVDACQQ